MKFECNPQLCAAIVICLTYAKVHSLQFEVIVYLCVVYTHYQFGDSRSINIIAVVSPTSTIVIITAVIVGGVILVLVLVLVLQITKEELRHKKSERSFKCCKCYLSLFIRYNINCVTALLLLVIGCKFLCVVVVV